MILCSTLFFFSFFCKITFSLTELQWIENGAVCLCLGDPLNIATCAVHTYLPRQKCIVSDLYPTPIKGTCEDGRVLIKGYEDMTCTGKPVATYLNETDGLGNCSSTIGGSFWRCHNEYEELPVEQYGDEGYWVKFEYNFAGGSCSSPSQTQYIKSGLCGMYYSAIPNPTHISCNNEDLIVINTQNLDCDDVTTVIHMRSLADGSCIDFIGDTTIECVELPEEINEDQLEQISDWIELENYLPTDTDCITPYTTKQVYSLTECGEGYKRRADEKTFQVFKYEENDLTCEGDFASVQIWNLARLTNNAKTGEEGCYDLYNNGFGFEQGIYKFVYLESVNLVNYVDQWMAVDFYDCDYVEMDYVYYYKMNPLNSKQVKFGNPEYCIGSEVGITNSKKGLCETSVLQMDNYYNSQICGGEFNTSSSDFCISEIGYITCMYVEIYCFSKYFASPDVCSGHGYCLSTDYCSCYSNEEGYEYYGYECQSKRRINDDSDDDEDDDVDDEDSIIDDDDEDKKKDDEDTSNVVTVVFIAIGIIAAVFAIIAFCWCLMEINPQKLLGETGESEKRVQNAV